MFYFLWVNCLISFAFLLSTFFRSARTAVVVAFLYTFATGLIGYLLLSQFIQSGHWWYVELWWRGLAVVPQRGMEGIHCRMWWICSEGSFSNACSRGLAPRILPLPHHACLHALRPCVSNRGRKPPSFTTFALRVIFLELVPGWALYRGLFEMGAYAFRGAYKVG